MGQTDNGYDLRLFKERILQILPASSNPRIGLMVLIETLAHKARKLTWEAIQQ
ncbi:MAG: hypothetical protein K5651_09510 [Bacteroidales bacterium]|nr:hypothetical protein [Bacteroidales bacterium]